MQYLLMCHFNEQQWTALPEAKRGEIMRDYEQWVQGLVRSGHYRAGARLDGTATATTLRDTQGRARISDGPFAETKEQLGGYHLVECRDRDEAVALGQQIPTLPFGGAVEVRPVLSSW